MNDDRRITVLAGGVGGAKLVDGFASILPPDQLTVIVNTADDFVHLGLTVCPDVDTIIYTLAGLANPTTGWGRADESWDFLETLAVLGGPTWFQIGDRDLALHHFRTENLRLGKPLSVITGEVSAKLGVEIRVIPMSDDPIRTRVETDKGVLAFQEYFVTERYEPRVLGFHFEGIDESKPAPGVLEALRNSTFNVLAPSNPWVSLDPILAVPGIREILKDAMTIGVSPIVGGKALKGPAAKMFEELGIQPSAVAVADHYVDLLDGWMIDDLDQSLLSSVEELGIKAKSTQTIMKSRDDRSELARRVLQFASELEGDL